MKKSNCTLSAAIGFLYLQTVCVGQAAAPSASDILSWYEKFLATQMAALACGAVDKSAEQKFWSNQGFETIRTTDALRKQLPDASNTEVLAKLAAAQKAAQETMTIEITRNGCSSASIQSLLNSYKQQVGLSPGG